MSNHACPVCYRNDALFTLCQASGHVVYGCRNCGAEHVFPMPDSQELKAYYDREEWFEGGEVGGYEDYERQSAWSVSTIRPVLEEFAERPDLSILDVGCGYGAHLELAANLGWKCFGVELSDHARKVAQTRLGGRAYIVESVGDMIPHEFDVVLMLDVLEHLAEPYALFYGLFSIGAITPRTHVIITTPNAGSIEAQQDPVGWAYRHPPSHLLYYRAETLSFLLGRLHFTVVDIRGEHPLRAGEPEELELADYGGLMVQAYGSNFAEFMRERYVPGTWSKIAEYEHLPRYELAKRIAVGKAVLDFGCGTGYGSAALATVAERVIGLDIDASAISWAQATHRHPGLTFHRCDDLGASLPAASFDIVTCFEMIEHVNLETQLAVVAAMARLLTQDGVLIISTPNPAVTGLYGANPFHLREMTREEFLELLEPQWPYTRVLEQRVRYSISFDVEMSPPGSSLNQLASRSGIVPSLAYVALCSKQPLPEIGAEVMFDQGSDAIGEFLRQEKRMNTAKLSIYSQGERIENLIVQSAMLTRECSGYSAIASQLAECREQLAARDEEIGRSKAREQELEAEVERANAGRENFESAVATITSSDWYRLGQALRERPLSWAGMRAIVQQLAKWVPPRRLKVALRYPASPPPQPPDLLGAEEFEPYEVKLPAPALANRPRIVHVIANFCTGGSSRLVVDLLEHLGQFYDQSELTRHIPSPPAYRGLDITELRHPADPQPFETHFGRKQPDFIHVHYWGEIDEDWYAKAFKAAEKLGIPVIENLNTPVAPYLSATVRRFVYVSDYVRRVFGRDDPAHVTIYPGSDFSHFVRGSEEMPAENCVGMVYRLESDKLSEVSILPFIRAVQKRPGTTVLIVGGGTLLEGYRQEVEKAGLSGSFEFPGYVSYSALPDYYRRMTVFAAPVWKESFGQVSAFAMNMGVPVCGYDIGAMREIVGDPRLLAPAADAERLADIIVHLLDAPEERRTIGEFLRGSAQARFSVSAMIQSYALLYRQMMGVPR